MQQGNWQLPVPRLTTIVTSGIADFLPFCAPGEPSHVGAAATAGLTQPVPSNAVLHALCGALLHADISHIQPRLPVAPLVGQPGTLEHALVDLNQHVFQQAGPSAASLPGASATQPVQQAEQQKPAPRAKAAKPRPAAEAEEGGPAAKRRRRAASTDEQFVSRTVDAQQIAADVAAVVSEFIAKAAAFSREPAAAAIDGADDSSEEDADAATVARSRRTGRKAAGRHPTQQATIPVEQLKQLQTGLATGKQAGIIAQLDHEALRQLLLLLLDHVRLGQEQLLDENDTASSDSSKAVSVALEAACCCMQLLAAPNLPNSLYMDEVMTAVVQLAKYQLQFNVLALHDPQYKRLYRPSAAHDDGQPVSSRKRARESTGGRASRVLNDVRAKLEMLLSLLAQVVGRVLLEVELLLPLVRMALTCLSVESLQLLQAQAIALAVSVFSAYPQQRSSLADEVLTTVLGNIHVPGAGRAPPRLFEATGPNLQPLPIQMATALIMELVQVSTKLPEMDADPSTIQLGYRVAAGWSDMLWAGMFSKLPAAKAAKSEGAADFKAVMQALLSDLLTVQMLPEWPAATLLLRRFVKMLASDKGLKHSDAAVKLAAVEFTGQLATALCQEASQAEKESDKVQALKEAAQAAADPTALEESGDRFQQLANMLLLDFLAASGGGSSHNSSSSDATASARRFICCRMLHDAIQFERLAGKQQHSDQELTLLLVQHRKLQDSQLPVLGGASASVQLSRSQAVSLVRQGIIKAGLGAGRAMLIKWLLEAGSRLGPDPSPATVRTKVFKCLGGVVEADSRVMALSEVSAAVRAALEDDSVAVREATLELLTRLISTNPLLAGDYFDVLVQASYDPGVSVRKRAIRALWDCCTCPGFSRASEAVVAVLQRAADPEESMKSLVTKICGEMWFTETSSFAGFSDGDAAASSAAAASRSAAVRAAALASVSLRVYEAGGRTIHVPLPSEHGLVLILKEVLGTSSSSGCAAASAASVKEDKGRHKEQLVMRAGAAEVAQALLTLILQHQQQQEPADESGQPQASSSTSSSSSGPFQYLLALHALCAADASLAAAAADSQRFMRCLAPYVAALGSVGVPAQQGTSRLSSAGAGGIAVDDASRTAAEEGLCLLAILESLLRHLGNVEQDVAQQLAGDLLLLINKQRYPQLIASGCQLLCVLGALHAPAAAHVAQLANKCFNIAAAVLNTPQTNTSGSPAHTLAHAPRVLYILGQLCRHGAALLDAAAAATPSSRNCTECLELCVSLWYKRDLPDSSISHKVREAALQALGMIVIGKPQLMLQPLQLNLLEHQHSVGPAAAQEASSGHSGDAGSPADEQQQQQQGGGLQQGQQLVTQGSGVVMMGAGLSGISAAKLYAAALSGPQVPLSVKSKVLTSLVELLRCEEAALLCRQKEAEVASTSSRMPTTLPAYPDSKAPLAKVNGEADAAGGSSSSSVVQQVWEDVLHLATGVAGGGSTPPPTPLGVAAAMEAANMRRKALELIEVVLRGGLVAPWTAVPPLVAQLTDEAQETRAAALKVLKGAADKYADYVGNQLGPGVLEAYHFQNRLWAAKHPGQPLPQNPSPEVLSGLSAMYSDIIQPTATARQRFLASLLKPFEAACNLAANPAAAAREDMSRLAFCAYVAANLPFKRGDEPLALLHVVNGLVSRSGQEARDVLRVSLIKLKLRDKMGLEEEDVDVLDSEEAEAAVGTNQQHHQPEQQQAPQDAAAAAAAAAEPTQPDLGSEEAAAAAEQQQQGQQKRKPKRLKEQQQSQQPPPLLLLPQPLPQWACAPLKASLGLSMLLVLKQYLMAAFSLSDERVAQFELKGERMRGEVKALISRSKKVPEFSLSVVNLRCVHDATGDLLVEQFKTFGALLDNDAANYKEVAVLAALADHDSEEEEEAAGGPDASRLSAATPATAAAGRQGHTRPGSALGPSATSVGLVVYSKDTSKKRPPRPRAASAAKGQAGASKGKGSRSGTAVKTGGRGSSKRKAKRRRFDLEDSEGDESAGEDEDWGSPKRSKARVLF